MEFCKVDSNKSEELSVFAKSIWLEYFPNIIGEETAKYLYNKVQSAVAILEQFKKGYQYYYMVENGEKVGYFAICVENTELLLSKFYVKKEHRGKKYGKLALEFIQNYAKLNNLKSVYLYVNKNNISSQRVYEKFGFKQKEGIVFDMGNGFVMDDYKYELKVQ